MSIRYISIAVDNTAYERYKLCAQKAGQNLQEWTTAQLAKALDNQAPELKQVGLKDLKEMSTR